MSFVLFSVLLLTTGRCSNAFGAWGDGDASAMSCFVVRQAVLHWDVAEYRRLYLSMLDARCFGAKFSDEQKSRMYGRMGSNAARKLATEVKGRRALGRGMPLLWIPMVVLMCRPLVTRMKFRKFALCVVSYLKQRTSRIRWKICIGRLGKTV